MHDSIESIIGDIPYPIKLAIPGIMEFEESLQESFQETFGYSIGPLEKKLDAAIWADEKSHFFPTSQIWPLVKSERLMGVKFMNWDPSKAKWIFLYYYNFLFEKLTNPS
jgi:hypothetical protein